MPLLLPLAVLPEILVGALVAAILVYAAQQLLMPYLSELLTNLPVIGRAAATALGNLISKVAARERAWWDSAITPLIALVYSAPRKIDLWMYAVEDVLRKMAAQLTQAGGVAARLTGVEALYQTVQVLIQRLNTDAAAITRLENLPHLSTEQVQQIADHVTAAAVTALTTQIHDALHTAETYAQSEAAKAAALAKGAQQSVNTLAVQVGKVANSLQALVQQVGDLTPALVDSELAHTLAGAEAYTQKQETIIRGEITGALTNGEQYANNLVSTLQTTVNDAISQVDQGIINAKQALQNNITAVGKAAHTYTNDVETKLSTNIGEVSVALAATQAAVKAVSTAFEAYKEGCGDPICNWYKPQMSKMQSFSELLTMGGIFAFVVEAAVNPEGAANMAQSVFEPVAQEVHDALAVTIGAR